MGVLPQDLSGFQKVIAFHGRIVSLCFMEKGERVAEGFPFRVVRRQVIDCLTAFCGK